MYPNFELFVCKSMNPLVNIVGHPGAIGFIPPLLKNKLPITLIKLDDDDQPVRDPKTGLTVLVGIGEHGELVGEIEEGNPPREFRGYAQITLP